MHGAGRVKAFIEDLGQGDDTRSHDQVQKY